MVRSPMCNLCSSPKKCLCPCRNPRRGGKRPADPKRKICREPNCEHYVKETMELEPAKKSIVITKSPVAPGHRPRASVQMTL